MRGGMRSAVSAVGSLAVVVTLAGCAGSSWQFWKTSASTEETTESAVATTAPDATRETGAPATPHAPTAAPAPAETARVASSNGFTALPELADVRFRSGQVALTRTDRKIVDDVARWLEEHPSSVVMIEAHTDDLGTREGNLAVGDKRAASIMKYLVSKGLEPRRISAVSVGPDRPVCAEKTEACRARNRRARFLVKP